jgi:hypothetical protein
MSLPPPTPDDERLAHYLLGALPDDETERLDELSIADASFADRLNAVEYDLVDSFVRGELSGDMLARFQSRCLSSSAMREKVKVAESFAAYQQRSPGPGRRSFRAESLPRWALAAAASLALVAAGYLATETRRLRTEVAESRSASASIAERERELQRQLEERRAAADAADKELARARDALAQLEARLNAAVGTPVVAAFLLPPARRGLGDVTTIAIPRGAGAIALRMEPEADEFARYRASIKDSASDRVIWRSGDMKPKASGAAKIVEATVPSALLKPQTYLVELAGMPATGAAGRFAGSFVFRVMVP